MAHHEVPVKVNAWVDEGVRPLVEALNSFPWVESLGSCEGNKGAPADVIFRSRDGAGRVIELGDALAQVADERFEFELLMEWRAGYVGPRAVLRTDDVSMLAATLRQLAATSTGRSSA